MGPNWKTKNTEHSTTRNVLRGRTLPSPTKWHKWGENSQVLSAVAQIATKWPSPSYSMGAWLCDGADLVTLGQNVFVTRHVATRGTAQVPA